MILKEKQKRKLVAVKKYFGLHFVKIQIIYNSRNYYNFDKTRAKLFPNFICIRLITHTNRP